MKSDLLVRFTFVIGASALFALFAQFYLLPFITNSNSSVDDEFAIPGDISGQQFTCGAASGARVTSRKLYDETAVLAQTIKNGVRSNSRQDLLQWRTKRNQALKKRAGVRDFAAFDALRPAYDSMCQSAAFHNECFRPLLSSSSSSSSSSTSAAAAAAGAAAVVSVDTSKMPSWANAVRRQLRLWSPSTSAFMQRPTLLCVSLVADQDRIEHALTQWKLWGRNCDDFFIALELETADINVVHNATRDKATALAKHGALLNKYDFPANHLWPVRPLVSWKIQDAVRFDRWQAFRELSRVMSDEDLNHPVYQAEYTMFVRDDAYVVPENVFGFLSSPEVRHLEHISAPVLLGHVLQVPPPVSGSGDDEEEAQVHDDHKNDVHQPQKQNQAEDKHNHQGANALKLDKTHKGTSDLDPISQRRLFASIDGGLIWNRITRKLFMNAIRSQDVCAFANTEADDVMLADCFRYYGIHPIDTADSRGSDRQHILRPEWAMTIGRDPALVEWYSLFRGRPSLEGAAAISPTSMTFGGLNSIEEIEELHKYLSE